MHYFEGGGSIGRFPLATNESYVNKSTGEKVTNTEWHNIVVRNKAAEMCEKYLSKGDKIYIEGRIKTRKWTGEDGNDRYSTEINVNEFTFLSTKKDVRQASPIRIWSFKVLRRHLQMLKIYPFKNKHIWILTHYLI